MRRIFIGRAQLFWFFLAAAGLACLPAGSCFAQIPVGGAKAGGMGTAFVAVADDPSAIMYNPAGLTGSRGTRIYGGVTAVIPSSRYESPSGDSEESEFQVFFPPHLYMSSDLHSENLAVGLGIFSPFGVGGLKWSDTGLTRYASTESIIGTLAVNPVVAYRVSPSLSVGFGVFYMYGLNTAERMVNQSALGAGDARYRFAADGGGFGFNLGLLVTPSDWLSLGFAYRSRTNVDESGTVKLRNIAPALQPLFGGSRFKTDVETTLHFPEDATAGVAFRPTERLTLAADVEWVNWSRFSSYDLDFKQEVPAAGFTDVSIPLDWRDSWLFKAGGEYKINSSYALRLGYAYVTTPVPQRTLSPDNPIADDHNFCIGFGYASKGLVVDAFYNPDFFGDRRVENSILSGKYKNFTQFIGLSIGYGF
jgi:long-chain fatty acid transport protein